jgi:hypothetical protein
VLYDLEFTDPSGERQETVRTFLLGVSFDLQGGIFRESNVFLYLNIICFTTAPAMS